MVSTAAEIPTGWAQTAHGPHRRVPHRVHLALRRLDRDHLEQHERPRCVRRGRDRGAGRRRAATARRRWCGRLPDGVTASVRDGQRQQLDGLRTNTVAVTTTGSWSIYKWRCSTRPTCRNFGAFGAAWDDAMVARWRANPPAMLWPERGASFGDLGRRKCGPAGNGEAAGAHHRRELELEHGVEPCDHQVTWYITQQAVPAAARAEPGRESSHSR